MAGKEVSNHMTVISEVKGPAEWRGLEVAGICGGI